MKSYMKKWCLTALLFAVVCSMLLPVTAFAEDAEEEYVEPKIIVTGVPTEPVLAGSTVTFQISVQVDDEENIEGWRLTMDRYYPEEGWFDSDEQVILAEQVERDAVYEVSIQIPADQDFCPYGTVWLQNEVGSYLDWAFVGDGVQVQARLTGSISWNPVEEVIAGQEYPFSVTYTNHSGEAYENLTVETCAVAHNFYWEATVVYDAQDGLVIGEKGSAVIARIGAGESYTVSGTISFPIEAAADLETHMSQYLFRGEQLLVSVSSEDVAISDANYRFVVVAPKTDEEQSGGQTDGKTDGQTGEKTDGQTDGKNDGQASGTGNTTVNTANSGAVKTGDTASAAGWTVAGIAAIFAGILAWRKRETLR